jgi:hypothetical protein
MKRALIAAIAAMALVGTTTEKASAWCKFNFSGGVSMGFETSGRYVKRAGKEKWSYPPPGSAGFGGFGGPVAPPPVPGVPTSGAIPGVPTPGAPVPGAPAPAGTGSGAYAAPMPTGPVQSVGYYTYPGYPSTQPIVWWSGN